MDELLRHGLSDTQQTHIAERNGKPRAPLVSFTAAKSGTKLAHTAVIHYVSLLLDHSTRHGLALWGCSRSGSPTSATPATRLSRSLPCGARGRSRSHGTDWQRAGAVNPQRRALVYGRTVAHQSRNPNALSSPQPTCWPRITVSSRSTGPEPLIACFDCGTDRIKWPRDTPCSRRSMPNSPRAFRLPT
jgi:hypothetical protein